MMVAAAANLMIGIIELDVVLLLSLRLFLMLD
jgi:hypothetical protein